MLSSDLFWIDSPAFASIPGLTWCDVSPVRGASLYESYRRSTEAAIYSDNNTIHPRPVEHMETKTHIQRGGERKSGKDVRCDVMLM